MWLALIIVLAALVVVGIVALLALPGIRSGVGHDERVLRRRTHLLRHRPDEADRVAHIER